jgi:hypothetical protein
VNTIDCIVCSPFFRKELNRIDGIVSVDTLPMLNKILVAFDPDKISTEKTKREILRIAAKGRFGSKIIFDQ